MLYFFLHKLYDTISVYLVVLCEVQIQITLDIQRAGPFSHVLKKVLTVS